MNRINRRARPRDRVNTRRVRRHSGNSLITFLNPSLVFPFPENNITDAGARYNFVIYGGLAPPFVNQGRRSPPGLLDAIIFVLVPGGDNRNGCRFCRFLPMPAVHTNPVIIVGHHFPADAMWTENHHFFSASRAAFILRHQPAFAL